MIHEDHDGVARPETSPVTDRSGFIPSVLKNAWQVDTQTMTVAQRLSDDALARHFKIDDATAPTEMPGLYACRDAVQPHQDLDGAVDGMHVYGLVIRSNGHRLHSERLDRAGVRDGLLLEAGDFYELDPYDTHWTSVPDQAEETQLIFYVEGEIPDGRSLSEVAGEMAKFLTEDLIPSISREDPSLPSAA